MFAFVVGLVALAALVVVATAFALARQRRFFGGFWLWEQRRLAHVGLRARATTIERVMRDARWAGGTVMGYDLVLEVCVDGRPPYRVPFSCVGHWYETSTATEDGATLPVLVDPHDPSRVMVDFERVWAARRAASSAGVGGASAR